MTLTDPQTIWQRQLEANNTLYEWNRFVLPLMRSEPEFKMMAIVVAKARGWKYDPTTGAYIEAPVLPQMHLTKGRNIIRVGWQDGTLYVEFSSGAKAYTYPDVPEVDFVHLKQAMYPDKLWAAYRKRYEAQAAEKQEAV